MNDYQELLKRHAHFYSIGHTKDIAFRRLQLKKLRQVILHYEADILRALKQDLNKAPFEAYETEVGIVLQELNHTIKHLYGWARTSRVHTPLMHFPASSYIYREPYGTVLIMSPWNYPFQLTLVPLIGALAAGNCVVLKPSEYSVHTAAVIEKMITENFDSGYISVVRGGRDANRSLLDQRFDYIFFTGSPTVGRLVMKSAAWHLTPVTLELGGKSPCIVDETAKLDLAAKRIAWGKFLNAGQTCVAPDYLLVHPSVKDALMEKMKEVIHTFYGDDVLHNNDYPKIINRKHFERLQGLMKDETLFCGGSSDAETLSIEPAILSEATWDSPVMQEEIFGPLLPVLSYDNLQDTLELLQKQPKPLAFYYFTQSKKRATHALRQVSFGGGCINDTIIHLSNPHLHFGGVGESGMGQYHGKASFDTFTHQKSVIKKSTSIDISLPYPPYKNHLPLLRKFMR